MRKYKRGYTLRNKYPCNLIFSYINVNSLTGTKLDHIREMCRIFPHFQRIAPQQNHDRYYRHPFMTKNYSMAIKKRSNMRNKYNKWKSRENYLMYQRAKYDCKKHGEVAKRDHLKKDIENGIMTIKIFWNTFKPLLNN